MSIICIRSYTLILHSFNYFFQEKYETVTKIENHVSKIIKNLQVHIKDRVSRTRIVIYLIEYNIALVENNSASSADLFIPEG